MAAKLLMIQGTSSSAGKSLLVAALCHIFARKGLRVAPFKAQNMSNNAAICRDGSEIGRAQAVQAYAAGVEPVAEMNPILLKPEADSYSQVIVLGRPYARLAAREYYRHKEFLWTSVIAGLDRLRNEYELVIIEGAGSPVELNLKAGDMVNMAVAQYGQAPVLLVGDIDRGGIYAQLLGTLWLLPPEERSLVKGLLVNKFRGDISLFSEGIHILEEKGAVPVLGVIPYLQDLRIPEEDAVVLESREAASPLHGPATEIAVIRFPRISNFDDFDPIASEPGVRLRYVDDPQNLGNPQAVILPGTKSTIADLAWLRSRGLDSAIQAYARWGGLVVGICGGYQMLGRVIRDPDHSESEVEVAPGLDLLPVETVFSGEKATFQARARVFGRRGWLSMVSGTEVDGYEIHMGRTTGGMPWLELFQRNHETVELLDGSTSPDGKIWGCYLHGLFVNDVFRRAWLASLGWKSEPGVRAQEAVTASAFTALADGVEAALDMPRLEKIIWGE